jgi:Protein of unknown function (DUF1573)
LLLIWLGVGIPFAAFSQRMEYAHLSSAARPGKIVQWQQDRSFDFDQVPSGGTVSTVFTFKNISNHPIQLEAVRTTCGCTAAQWTEAPIPPGATGSVKIEYAADRSGPFRKKIRVFFDRQRKAEILWISGEVE